ncbi:hypothetical protein MBLNU230_g7946t1 [Neophaeotheca triangularis]
MATSRTLLSHALRLTRTTTTTPATHARLATRTLLNHQTPALTRNQPSTRFYSTPTSAPEPPDYLDERELHIFRLIKEKLAPTQLEVQDISGGCGSMYALDITSKQFEGLPVIKQHRLVNSVLGEEIKKWHGVQLKTKAG